MGNQMAGQKPTVPFVWVICTTVIGTLHAMCDLLTIFIKLSNCSYNARFVRTNRPNERWQGTLG